MVRAILPAMAMLLACQASRIHVRTPPGTTVDGRLLVVFSRAAEGEPRLQVTDDDTTAQVFGVDVARWSGGAFAGEVAGYPLASLAALPAGEYTVQAVLHC